MQWIEFIFGLIAYCISLMTHFLLDKSIIPQFISLFTSYFLLNDGILIVQYNQSENHSNVYILF